MYKIAQSKLCWLVATLSIGILYSGTFAIASDVRISQDALQHEFSIGSKSFLIKRNQDQKNVITGTYAKTSRACPPFCIHPMKAAEGVETIGELEIIQFLETDVSKGEGLLVDARIPSWYNKGTIPGSLNIPFTLFSKNNPFLEDLLPALGAKRVDDKKWDFSKSKKLVLFCNGPWCDQSPRAIKGLLSIGYPAERLFYYRGGMQNWALLGLSTEIPGNNKSAQKSAKN